MRWLMVLAMLVASLTTAPLRADPPEVRLYSFRVLYPHSAFDVKHAPEGELWFSVAAVLPGLEAVGFDVSKSKLKSFTDDKGTVLMTQPANRPWLNPGILAKQGDAFIIDLHSQRLPVAGAKSVRIDAEVVVRYAKGSKVSKAEGFKLEVGQKTRVGPVELWVESAEGRPTLVARHAEDEIRKLEVVDALGKPIPLQSGQGGPVNGRMFWTKRQPIPIGAGVATIRVDAVESFEEVAIPIVMEIGLGGEVRKRP